MIRELWQGDSLMSRQEDEKKYLRHSSINQVSFCSIFPAAPFISEFGEQENLFVFSSSGNLVVTFLYCVFSSKNSNILMV